MQGSDFHVPGQNFGAQPGGQVGGGGGSIGIPGNRGPPVGNIQSIGQTASGLAPGVSSSGQPQAGPVSNLQSQPPQGSSGTTTVLNSASQEMNKQTHLQAQPPSMQQVYVQNPNRSASQQSYYSTGPRSQQPRNLTHRGAPSSNQNQVVGMTGVGTASGQPPAMYPHPSITMQPPTMYVQSPVSGIHTNPHQQNVYSVNNQMPMQYSGPPQRHQTHQNQFPYQSYQAHTLLTASNVFGYTHGTQHPGFFYSPPSSTQLSLNRPTGNSISTGNQHISGSITNTTVPTIVPQANIQQQTPQPQTMHTINLPIPQTDVYSGFNGGPTNLSTRSKKPRTKAITDIVNPHTGKNISDEIYKDDVTALSGESSSRESPQSVNCSAELVADFAARVAKLASESATTITGNPNLTSQITKRNTAVVEIIAACTELSQHDNDSLNINESMSSSTPEIKESNLFHTELEPRRELKSIDSVDDLKTDISITSNILGNILSEKSNSSYLDRVEVKACDNDVKLSVSPKQQDDIVTRLIVNSNEEIGYAELSYNEGVMSEKLVEKVSASRSIELEIQQETDNLHQKINGEGDTKCIEVDIKKTDLQQQIDGKMQKQKTKKVKSRELNRRGAEKEGTDMDAFVKPRQTSPSSMKIEMKQGTALSKDIIKDEDTEITKDSKEKDNYESRKERDTSAIQCPPTEKSISTLEDDKEKIFFIEKDIAHRNKNNKEDNLEETLINAPMTNDVVDHITIYRTKVDTELEPSIVAQKNEENSKVSGLSNALKESDGSTSTGSLITTKTAIKVTPSLKYKYSDDQWSPINTSGKKVYDREFLMKLQNEPNSKIKPLNLPDLDVVLKDNTKSRNPVDPRFKETNISRHDALLPGFVKSSVNAKVSISNRRNNPGKLKTSKPNVIQISLPLREDVKLRETENAWKPTRLVQGSISEERDKTETLYKRVRSVLNKLTPEKFNTLVNQVRELKIDTQERLQGVINLVFEKAVDEPNFSVAYALMCKELSNIEVTGADSEDSSSANFRKLILTRCQSEFEKNTVDENARSQKLREIEECSDPEKKKELQINFDEEERRIRLKSVGNIRFIGELFKQNMLSSKIMHTCIRHLLSQADEENLECLCKLLTTIGRVLQEKNIDLSEYFKQMHQIANQKGKVSSRIRFMLQDVIDLKANKWIPRRDDSNPKTMDQIQKDAENERLDIQLNNASLHTPRKDERINDRKRNRGVGAQEDGGWSAPVGRARQVYSVETSKLKSKAPAVDDMQLGSRSNYQWSPPNLNVTMHNKFSAIAPEADKRAQIQLPGSKSTGSRDYGRSQYKSNYDNRNSRSGSYQLPSNTYTRDAPVLESSRSQSLSLISSSKSVPQTVPVINVPELSTPEFDVALDRFLEEYVATEGNVEEAVKEFRNIFPVSSHLTFVQETINGVLEKSDHHRNKTSQLLAQLLFHKCINPSDFKKGVDKILEQAKDLIIDIPKLWKYFAKILVYPIINDTYPFTELKSTTLRNHVNAIELVAELMSEIKELKGTEWANKIWTENKLQWNDFADEHQNIDQIMEKHKLEFLSENKSLSIKTDGTTVNIEKIQNNLLTLLKDKDFDNICDWIQTNVGDSIKEPKFIRGLMTAILETSVEECNDKWIFKVENFEKLQNLIQRYVDADDYLELQCLFAVQAYINKLSHPQGLLLKIVTSLLENNVLSNEAFLAWEKNDDKAEREGKSVAIMSLKSFFIPLKEGEDISSSEEA